MQTVKIKTPLNVIVDAPYAGAGLRIVAFFLDAIFMGLYLWGIIFVFFDLLNFSSSIFDLDQELNFFTFIQVLFMILLFPVIFYSLWTESLFNGQTLGKMICGIRVIKLNGYKAGFPEFFTRWVFRFIDIWTGSFMLLFFIPIFGEIVGYSLASMMTMLTGFVAFISIVRSKKSQRIGDIVAGTTVLKLKSKSNINITILEELEDTYVPTYREVLKLTDNDARIIKDTYTLALKAKDYRTLQRLRERLEEVMGIKADLNDANFIDTVMKDFNYYTQKL